MTVAVMLDQGGRTRQNHTKISAGDAMLTVFDTTLGTNLAKRDGHVPIGDTAIWLDLLNPTAEDDAYVEKSLGIAIPTRAEMREIEASSRHYTESGAHYMTAFVVYDVEAPQPKTTAMTFILAGQRLITVRYAEPKAFPLFLARVEKGDAPCNGAASLLIGLIESIIHREADLIERIQDEVDRTAPLIFDIKGGQSTRSKRLETTLRMVGREGDITARAQESALSLERTLSFLANAAKERGDDNRIQDRINIAHRDVHSLMEHMRFLSARVDFLLNATLGMISTEQNKIIKLFSVAAVMLMPPTLVASVYGMNFKKMPELEWVYGYPSALGLMVVSALVPYLFFRRKGWL
jgi:magnesium transporter